MGAWGSGILVSLWNVRIAIGRAKQMMLDLEDRRMEPLLVRHLEAHLGTILHGWSLDADGDTVPFQVVELSDGKEPSVHTYSTLGLSNHPLRSRVSNKEIRCELVMVARNGSDAIPGVLQQVGRGLIQALHGFPTVDKRVNDGAGAVRL